MKITITFNIESKHIIWAIYMLLGANLRVSKKGIVEYLRRQIEQFGSDEDTLFGENYNTDLAGGDLDNDRNYVKALELFETKYSELAKQKKDYLYRKD